MTHEQQTSKNEFEQLRAALLAKLQSSKTPEVLAAAKAVLSAGDFDELEWQDLAAALQRYEAARIERVTYVPEKWTDVTLMVPRTEREPGGSLCLTLNAEQLKRFVETLKWPE